MLIVGGCAGGECNGVWRKGAGDAMEEACMLCSMVSAHE